MYSMMFQSTEEIYRAYLKVSQGAVARICQEGTPGHVEGLCTDGLSACVCIIFISKDGKKISLTHTDLAVDTEAIIAECQWMAQPCTLFFVRGTCYRDSAFESQSQFSSRTLLRIQKAIIAQGIEANIDVNSYDTPTWSVAVTRAGQINVLNNKHRVGQTAPNIELRHNINMLNHYALQWNGCYHPLDVQYDSISWTPITRLSNDSTSLLAIYQGNEKELPALPGLRAELQSYCECYRNIKRESQEKNSMAVRYYKEKNYLHAISSFKQAIESLSLLYADKHLDIASIYYNLGSAYKNTDDFANAIQYLEKAVEIRIRFSGETHEDTIKAKSRLEEVWGMLPRRSP